MKQVYAYVHARPDTKDVSGIFYVGKGSANRARDLRNDRNAWHQNIVNKYGTKNILLGSFSCSSEDTAFLLEKGLIKCLRRSGVTLANLTDGGEGPSGRRMTDEQRAKCVGQNNPMYGRTGSLNPNFGNGQAIAGSKNVMFGKTHSVEARAKIAAANKGRKLSLEIRHKVSLAGVGRKHSSETIAKMRISAHRGSDHHMFGKTHTPEAIAKQKRNQKARVLSAEERADKRNSRLSGCWITNGQNNLFIDEQYIDTMLMYGWRLGMHKGSPK